MRKLAHVHFLALNLNQMTFLRMATTCVAFVFAAVLAAQDTTWVQTYTWEAQNNLKPRTTAPGVVGSIFLTGARTTRKI